MNAIQSCLTLKYTESEDSSVRNSQLPLPHMELILWFHVRSHQEVGAGYELYSEVSCGYSRSVFHSLQSRAEVCP